MAKFEVKSKEEVNFVEVTLSNETIVTESGALRYMKGQVEMTSKMPGVSSFFKSKLTGENVFRPRYTGTGLVVLEPSFGNFHILELNNDTFILDSGAFWAAEDGIEVSAKMNKLTTSFLSGEGFFQTSVSGQGTVVCNSPGPVEIIHLSNDRLVVDGSFAIARSASLEFSVQKSTRSLMGAVTSGELLVNVFEGTGTVYLAPIPNKYTLLVDLIQQFVPRTSGK